MDFKDFIDITGKVLTAGCNYFVKGNLDAQRRFINSEEFNNMSPEEQDEFLKNFERKQDEFQSCQEEQLLNNLTNKIKNLSFKIKKLKTQPSISEEDQQKINTLEDQMKDIEEEYIETSERIEHQREKSQPSFLDYEDY